MSYEHLSDEDKLIEAIRFVARGAAMPHQLKEFLDKENLYDLITQPQETTNVIDQRDSGGHSPGLPEQTQDDIS